MINPDEMTTKQAIDIINGIKTLASAVDLTVLQVCRQIVFMNDERGAVIAKAVKLYNAYCDVGVVERGAMLGIKITEVREGEFTAQTTLSEH